jgi:hypothetical protein
MSAQVTGLCVGSVLTSPKRETLYMSAFSLVVSFPAICLRRWEVSCITYITTSRWLTISAVLLLSLGSVQQRFVFAAGNLTLFNIIVGVTVKNSRVCSNYVKASGDHWTTRDHSA